jgi:hypothetical protein
MAQPPDDSGDGLHIDMPARPQFPQGPVRHLATPLAGVQTPATPFSEGESMGSPRMSDRRALRYSMTSQYRSLLEDPSNSSTAFDKPPIPSALPLSSNDESTPLAKIPMIVLSIVSIYMIISPC